jgi:hypothetical protein
MPEKAAFFHLQLQFFPYRREICGLGRYCNEFSYRFNRREEQLQMFGMTVKNLTRGEILPYKKLTAKLSSD